MPFDPDQLTAAALRLPTHLRAQIAQALLASLDDDAELYDVERAWLAEAERSDRDLDAGAVALLPAEEAFRAARERLRRRDGE